MPQMLVLVFVVVKGILFVDFVCTMATVGSKVDVDDTEVVVVIRVLVWLVLFGCCFRRVRVELHTGTRVYTLPYQTTLRSLG